VDGLTDTPGSVFQRRYQRGSSGHPSTDAVADALQRPTRTLGRAALERALSGLAPGGVYLAFPVTREAGGLLHHRFTLTCTAACASTTARRRSVLCGTGLRVTPSGRYPPPCSAEPGRSSSHLRDARPPGQPIRCPFYGPRRATITGAKQVLRWENGRRTGGNPLPGLRVRKGSDPMDLTTIIVLIVVVVVVLVVARMSIRIVRQYEQGVLFRLGRVVGVRLPGLRFIIPVIDRLHLVSLRIVTMPIQSQGIITQDNVSVDISAVAYYRVVDAVKSVVAIENVAAAINQIAQTTLRKVVGRHSLDQTLSETQRINSDIREILDALTLEWGVEVTLVELKDIQLPDGMKRAMAKQAEAEREKRAKIIAAEGESIAATALGQASDTMMAHPLALQLRNLQSLVEIAVDNNSTVVFPAPLMSTIGELSAFLSRENQAAQAATAQAAQAATTQASPVKAA
jgi:regulator of protease activity HflC (stomatin/prohibitin superfamily)